MRDEQFADAVRHLGGAVQLEHVARGVVAADGAARLHRHAGVAADRELELDHQRRGAQRRVDVAVALADDRHLGVAAGRELAGLGVGGEQRRQLLDLDGRRDRPRPPPHRGPRRTPPRPDRRHSAPCRSPAPAAGRARASGCGPRGNRSAAHRRYRPRSTPRPRPAARAPPRCRPPRCGHARGSSARCAYGAGAETKCRRQNGRGRVTSGGSSSRSTDWPIHLLLPVVIYARSSARVRAAILTAAARTDLTMFS